MSPNYPSPDAYREAQAIVDSSPAINVYAACEWAELDANGRDWIATIVAEAQKRVSSAAPRPGKVCGDNLKPAPLGFTPRLVERLLDITPLAARSSQPPVEADSPIEPARVAPAQAAPSAPVESIPPALDRPDTLVTSGTPAANVVPITVASLPARRSDVRHRQSKDRDARALEAPIDEQLRAKRRELIRATAERLQQRKIALPTSGEMLRDLRSLGRPVAKTPTVPTTDFERRRRAIEGAIAFLKRECILVTVCDREALIRQYRVSGKHNAMLANEVIEFAAERGFEVPHA